MKSIESILVICSGNICRSPMAEGILKQAFETTNRTINVASCGTLRIRGAAAAEYAIQCCSEIDIDLSNHRSQGLSRELLQGVDAVIVMSGEHESAVLKLKPDANIYRLWEYLEPPKPYIYDPVGQDLQTFRRCRDELISALTCWIKRCL